MRASVAKKLRREVKKSEIKIAGKASDQFRVFVRSLPLRARVILAYKILRGIL